MTIKEKFSSIDQSKLTADQKAFLDKIKNVTKNFSDAEMNKKVETPLDNFIAKAKDKMPEAIKSAPVKRTPKAKSSQTRKPKRTAMSLAKEIRKEGESWSDARARASKMMKEDSKDLSKTVETELEKLSKLVKSEKTRSKLVGISGTDIKRDAVRKAKPRGARRVTHSGETSNQYGTFSNKLGRKYYESRDRHSDRLAPRYPKNAPLLAEGGDIDAFTLRMVKSNGMQPAEVLKEDTNVKYVKGGAIKNQYDGKTPEDIWNKLSVEQRKHFLLDHISGNEDEWSNGEQIEQIKYRYAGEDYREFIDLYSKSDWKKLSGDVRQAFREHVKLGQYNKGGALTNERKHVNKDEDYEVRYAKPRPSRTGYKGVRGFALGGTVVTDLAGHTGGALGGDRGMLSGNSGNFSTGLVGETGAMSSGEMFMNGGGLPAGVNQSYMVTEALGNPAQHFAKGGGVRIINGKEYATGRNWTNDHRHVNKGEEHEVSYNRKGKFMGIFEGGGATTNERKHVNHDEDYEVRYAKPRASRKGYKGARKFMSGGSMETPRIYVADLEAYNSGRLVGEWLDLADYDNADELMDAIQDVLKKSGGEEYAIHDVEYIPRSMYSEYMGKRDFEQLYEMMDLAKQNDLPLEVVQDIVSQYSENAVDDFVGKYDSAVDFAEELVDDLGIQSFTDFEYYLDISETDRRLLSQDMADSYVDDIKDEDGGNRLIQEANLDVEEYEEADSSTQEEMLENAREIVYDEYYDNFYEGLGDPYYFLVEEQGMYSAEDFANASFVRVDYEKLADALEQDYTMIEYDGNVYVFNIR
jgi:antirestriction protein